MEGGIGAVKAEAWLVGLIEDGMVELRRVMVKAKVKTVTINTSHNRCVEEKEEEEQTAPLCLWIDGWRSITFVLVLLFFFGERERDREREITFDICLGVREGQEKSRRRLSLEKLRTRIPNG